MVHTEFHSIGYQHQRHLFFFFLPSLSSDRLTPLSFFSFLFLNFFVFFFIFILTSFSLSYFSLSSLYLLYIFSISSLYLLYIFSIFSSFYLFFFFFLIVPSGKGHDFGFDLGGFLLWALIIAKRTSSLFRFRFRWV